MTDEQRLQATPDDVGGRLLAQGALVAVVLGVVGAAVTGVHAALHPEEDGAIPPALFALVAGAYAFVLRSLAVKRKHGAYGTVLVLGFLALDTAFFVVGMATKLGAASYVTG